MGDTNRTHEKAKRTDVESTFEIGRQLKRESFERTFYMPPEHSSTVDTDAGHIETAPYISPLADFLVLSVVALTVALAVTVVLW